MFIVWLTVGSFKVFCMQSNELAPTTGNVFYKSNCYYYYILLHTNVFPERKFWHRYTHISWLLWCLVLCLVVVHRVKMNKHKLMKSNLNVRNKLKNSCKKNTKLFSYLISAFCWTWECSEWAKISSSELQPASFRIKRPHTSHVECPFWSVCSHTWWCWWTSRWSLKCSG